MDSKKFTDGKFVAITATICCFLWGSAYPGIKEGYKLFNIVSEDVPSEMLFAGYRFVLAGIILLVIAQLCGKKIFNLSRRNVMEVSILGAIQTTLQYIFFYIGVANTTGVKGSIMNSTGAFFGVILAHFVYKYDRLTKRKSLGCIIGFIGVIIVNFNPELINFSFTLMGEGFVIIAALVFSVASIYCKKISRNINTMVMTGYSLFIGGIMLALSGIISSGNVNNFTLPSCSVLIYLALLSSVAFSLWNLLLEYNKVSLVSIYNFLTPIFGSVLSAIFLGETILEFKNIVALILVCIGIWMVNTVDNRTKVLSNDKIKLR